MKRKKKKPIEQVLKKKKPTAKQLQVAQDQLDIETMKAIESGHANELREKVFINEYLKDFNATRAYVKAGYTNNKRSAATLAGKILTKVDIQSAIKKRIESRMAALSLDQEHVLKNLLAIHERCMQAEPVLDSNGEPTGLYKFDASGANRSLELIGKHLNMFPTTLRNDPKNPVDVAKTIIYIPNNGR